MLEGLEKVDKQLEINELDGVTDVIVADLNNLEYLTYEFDENRKVLLINTKSIS